MTQLTLLPFPKIDRDARVEQRRVPLLPNPLVDVPVAVRANQLASRLQAMGTWTRVLWRGRSVWHRAHQRIRSFIASFYDEITSSPRKSLIELVLAAPVALLAYDKFRKWALDQQEAGALIVALILARAVFAAWRRGETKQLARDRVGNALQRMMPVIECTRLATDHEARDDRDPDHLRKNVETVLSAVGDLAAAALHVPTHVRLVTNLMVPMEVRVVGQSFHRRGCGIVAYNKIPGEPSWTRLAEGDLGAARALQTGKVQVVEDTTDPKWCGIFAGGRAKSFASFPVRAGTLRVIAVLNIDADVPMIFTHKLAEGLFVDVLAPALKLLGDLLFSANERAAQRDREVAGVS